jgi:hypothetical protein
MGGTGLESVTPSLSSVPLHSPTVVVVHHMRHFCLLSTLERLALYTVGRRGLFPRRFQARLAGKIISTDLLDVEPKLARWNRDHVAEPCDRSVDLMSERPAQIEGADTSR